MTLRGLIAHEIESAMMQHKRLYPDQEYRDANIALGGLRNVAALIAPQTIGMGNLEAAAILRALEGEP